MIIKVCPICKKKFNVVLARKETAHYCSFKCRNIGYLGKRVSKKSEFKKGQIFSKERNLKISKTHQKNHKLRKEKVLS